MFDVILCLIFVVIFGFYLVISFFVYYEPVKKFQFQ